MFEKRSWLVTLEFKAPMGQVLHRDERRVEARTHWGAMRKVERELQPCLYHYRTFVIQQHFSVWASVRLERPKCVGVG